MKKRIIKIIVMTASLFVIAGYADARKQKPQLIETEVIEVQREYLAASDKSIY